MVNRDIDNIEIPKYLWKPQEKIKVAKPNRAFDGETEKGYVRLMADSDGRKVVSNNLEDFLLFLNDRRHQKTVNWWYNLTYDTNSMLKYLCYDDRETLATYGNLEIGDYYIKVIPEKLLEIGKLSKTQFNKDGFRKVVNSTFFFDLAQFYDFKKLKTLAKQVNMEKIEVEDIENINWDKYQTDEIYHTLINNRCVVDCEITKALADKFTNQVNKLVIVNKYMSKASISRKAVLTSLKKQLTLPNYSMLKGALMSYHAGHIEVIRMGFMKNTHLYDINSAYPMFIRDLQETDGVQKENRDYEPDASYSYYHCFVSYNNEFSSPLWFAKNKNNYHITGDFETWISKPEYEFLNAKGFDLKIIRAYHLIPDRNIEKPFYNIVTDLYKRRLEAKKEEDSFEKVIKVCLNSLYGVTIQTIDKFTECEEDTDEWILNAFNEIINYKTTYKAGNMWNPLFACDVCSNTRMKIFNDFWEHLKYVNSFNTDGIYINKKLPHLKISDKLGDYSDEKVNNYLSLGSGRLIVFEDDGTVNNDRSRFRSVSNTPEEMYGLFDVNREQKQLEVKKTKVIKLKESLKNSKYFNRTFSSFPIQQYNETDLFNTFQTVNKKINFYESRRVWNNEFETIQDIFDIQLESRPYNVSELK